MSDRSEEPTGRGGASEDSTREASEQLGVPERIGVYRLLRRIGTGGMGEVYETEQEAPVRRKVALKLIKLGMDTRQIVARFESERQALALMSHTHIARVFDAGSTEAGRPYFVMEYVPGVALNAYCDRHELGVRERLELFVQVCEGIQHAHQKGIIHRDLKPGNVLVTLQDGRPIPKIIDFGLAKATGPQLTELTLLTHLGGPIGTPDYMSPEQADVTALDVDTRTDVYSLGVMLYELLVGMLPFDGRTAQSVEETLRRIREDDPRPPSARLGAASAAEALDVARKRRTVPAALVRAVRGDLDWIVMKATEKDRTRRYPTASDLAADVLRHLRDQPVEARPPSARYRLGKFVRRHRAGVLSASVVALALLLAVAGIGAGLLRARKAERVARQEAETARQVSEFLEGLFQVSDPGEARGNQVTAREILDRGARTIVEQMRQQPAVQARLMGTIGRVYMRLGLYADARPLLEEAYRAQVDAGGEGDPEVALALNNLGILAKHSGDLAGALEKSRKALAIAEKSLGPDDPRLAYILTCVGMFLTEQGDYTAARPLLERALAIREHDVRGKPEDLAVSLNNLALLLVKTGDLDRARPLYERVLEIDERVFGPDHRSVAEVLNNLAMLEQTAGALAKARPLYERALAIREKILGPDHPQLASTLSNLASLRQKLGDPAGARPLCERALAIFEKRLPPDHPLMAVAVSNLASILRELHDPGARALYERALAIYEKNHLSHRDVATVCRELADLLVEKREPAAALPLYERALAIEEKALGPDHPGLAADLDPYAALLRTMGRSAEAERIEARRRTLRAKP